MHTQSSKKNVKDYDFGADVKAIREFAVRLVSLAVPLLMVCLVYDCEVHDAATQGTFYRKEEASQPESDVPVELGRRQRKQRLTTVNDGTGMKVPVLLENM